MKPGDIEFWQSIWQASPILGVLALFLAVLMFLGRIGFINFNVSDAGHYDRIEQEHRRLEQKLEAEIRGLKKEIMALKLENARSEGERAAIRRNHDP